MKKSDISVCAVIYGICLFFLYMTIQLPEDAQTYPLCLISALAVLNTLYLGRAVRERIRDGVSVDDLRESFAGFKPGQFVVCCLLFIGYMVLLWLTGFYIASVVYLVVCMAFLRVPKLHILITTVVLSVVIWAVFTLFLKVPLPVGLLFK